jgi:hypothetical protein
MCVWEGAGCANGGLSVLSEPIRVGNSQCPRDTTPPPTASSPCRGRKSKRGCKRGPSRVRTLPMARITFWPQSLNMMVLMRCVVSQSTVCRCAGRAGRQGGVLSVGGVEVHKMVAACWRLCSSRRQWQAQTLMQKLAHVGGGAAECRLLLVGVWAAGGGRARGAK